jgi:hypothetical protein
LYVLFLSDEVDEVAEVSDEEIVGVQYPIAGAGEVGVEHIDNFDFSQLDGSHDPGKIVRKRGNSPANPTKKKARKG